ncbi:MAG: RlmE family RNA methyltransferase [Bacteriovoracales bacterium]|nr:RlmE family RNA methyltransferase [Bacteriovoracales bacterium]
MSFKVKDHFYKKAKKEKYLARSVYKLEEIDKKFKILQRGMRVLDLGYHPGSWAQYASKVVAERGLVVGVDLRPGGPRLGQLKNVKTYQNDVYTLCSPEDVEEKTPFDVVLSDMAPKTTGIKSVDQAKSLELVKRAFDLMPTFLRPGGDAVAKVFEGPESHLFMAQIGKQFDWVGNFKPQSTRSVSKEFFIVMKGFCPPA